MKKLIVSSIIVVLAMFICSCAKFGNKTIPQEQCGTDPDRFKLKNVSVNSELLEEHPEKIFNPTNEGFVTEIPGKEMHPDGDISEWDILDGDIRNEDDKEVNKYVYINPDGNTLLERIHTPKGYERAECNGFGNFLRDYPMLPDGSEVLLYDGSPKASQGDHVAVFDMDLVPGDLQQCADSCIRLYAEYLYGKGDYDKIAFHLVNGFLVDFDTWRKGGRVSVSGNHTEWVMNGEASDSQEFFEKYLKFVFTYASTLSMDKEAVAVDINDIQAGDLFIKGGSPGHVVMVLDVCVNDAGEKAFLLGQGYMPAQQFHVLKNPNYEDDPWYYVREMEYPFWTPEYVFDEGSFKRPVYDL